MTDTNDVQEPATEPATRTRRTPAKAAPRRRRVSAACVATAIGLLEEGLKDDNTTAALLRSLVVVALKQLKGGE